MNPPGNGRSRENRDSSVGSIGSPPRSDPRPIHLVRELAQTWNQPHRDHRPLPPVEESFSNLRISSPNNDPRYPSWFNPRLHNGDEVHMYPAAYGQFISSDTDMMSRLHHQLQQAVPHRNSPNLRMNTNYSLPYPICQCSQCRAPNFNLVRLATEHRTSRSLQNDIRTMSRDEIAGYFGHFIDQIEEMMSHPTASVLTQNLIEIINEDQIREILLRLCRRDGHVLRRLCSSSHGRKAVEKLLREIRHPHDRIMLMNTLQKHTLQLITHEEGHKIIEFCLSNFSDEENKLILLQVAHNCVGIATNKRGYGVLSRIIEGFSNGQLQYERAVLMQIYKHAFFLSSDPLGNFVVQNLLDQNITGCAESILLALEGHFYDLSVNKFGSNVVEKCLKIASPLGLLELIIPELINLPHPSLFLDNYGNYVMQTALRESQAWRTQIHLVLLDRLKFVAPRLRSMTFGKQLLQWLPRGSVPR